METIKVGLSKGVTLNLGNYESAKFDCWMEAEVLEKERLLKKLARKITNIYMFTGS